MEEKLAKIFRGIPNGIKVRVRGWDDDICDEIDIVDEVYEIKSDGYLRLKYREDCYEYNIDDVDIVDGDFGEGLSLMDRMDLIREKYKIHITTKPYITEEGIRYLFELYELFQEKFVLLKSKTGFDSNNDAIEGAISYCIEYVEQLN